MRIQTVEAWKRCPKCGKTENQVKAGRNSSGSQRCKCKECSIYYTIEPKRHEYPEEKPKKWQSKCTTGESAVEEWEKFLE